MHQTVLPFFKRLVHSRWLAESTSTTLVTGVMNSGLCWPKTFLIMGNNIYGLYDTVTRPPFILKAGLSARQLACSRGAFFGPSWAVMDGRDHARRDLRWWRNRCVHRLLP